MSSKNLSTSQVKHPFYPIDIDIPNYVPNTRNANELMNITSIVVIIVIAAAWYISGRHKEPFSFTRRAVLCWFLYCFFIHILMEGYFAVYYETFAGHSTVIAEIWKEYSLCDSRYLTSDAFTVCMETFAAIVNSPLALATFVAFMKDKSYRYVLQMVLSLSQFYGCFLYIITFWHEDYRHGPPDDLYIFYFYFVAQNMTFIVIPIALVIDAARHMSTCQTASDMNTEKYNRTFQSPKKTK